MSYVGTLASIFSCMERHGHKRCKVIVKINGEINIKLKMPVNFLVIRDLDENIRPAGMIFIVSPLRFYECRFRENVYKVAKAD